MAKKTQEKSTAKQAEKNKPISIGKTELLEIISDKVPVYSKSQVKEIFDVIVETIKEEATSGKEIRLVGFATFATKNRAARSGYNPQTGKAINIPARKVVACKLSSKWATIDK